MLPHCKMRFFTQLQKDGLIGKHFYLGLCLHSVWHRSTDNYCRICVLTEKKKPVTSAFLTHDLTRLLFTLPWPLVVIWVHKMVDPWPRRADTVM